MKHPFAELIGLEVVSYGEGKSHCKLEICEQHFNPQGVVHGAVLYALADTGMGSAVYTTLDGAQLTATIEIKISYFKPVREGIVECTSTVVNRGKTIASIESEVINNGEVVAKAYGTFAIFKI